VYYREDGHYIVVSDTTRELIQVSDRNKATWIDPLTHSPVEPVPLLYLNTRT
jgi:hypothetical protein